MNLTPGFVSDATLPRSAITTPSAGNTPFFSALIAGGDLTGDLAFCRDASVHCEAVVELGKADATVPSRLEDVMTGCMTSALCPDKPVGMILRFFLRYGSKRRVEMLTIGASGKRENRRGCGCEMRRSANERVIRLS